MDDIRIIEEFLNQIPTFYLGTIDGNQPRIRPIGFHLLQDNKLYFGVGMFKDVFHQMEINSNVEICASKGGKFLRYYGQAIFEKDDDIANQVLDKNPNLKRIYNQIDHKLAIFHLEQAIAEFYVMSKLKEIYHF